MKIINLTGDVGWEITASYLSAQLNGVTGDVILRVNSPGGYIFEGFELYNVIQDYQRTEGNKITAVINGLAASAASYFIMAAEKIVRRDNSVFMGHKAWAIMWGNSDDLQHEASILDGIDGIIADAYAKKTGGKKAAVLEQMKNEIWLFGEEIETAGYADDYEAIEEIASEVDAYTPAEARARVAATKNRVENFVKSSEDMKNKAAAWIKNSIDPDVCNSEAGKDENKINEEVSMNFEEFMKQNPNAKAEIEGSELFKNAIANGVKAESERISDILACSGVILSEEAQNAINTGIESGEFAKSAMKAQNAKRNEENKNQNLGSLNVAQTPGEQAGNTEDKNTEGVITSEEQARELAMKMYGGKK